MQVHVADHPLINHKLTYLRDRRTDSPTFRRLAEELVTLLAYEATREVRTEPIDLQEEIQKSYLDYAMSVIVGRALPDVRDGLKPVHRRVGFLGMVRDEETLEVSAYANRLPDSLHGRQVYVIDPMLATGHTLIMAFEFLRDLGADDITAVCLIAAPEGIETVREAVKDIGIPVTLVVGAIDDHLNEQGYIVPGLGDAGDRLYGVV